MANKRHWLKHLFSFKRQVRLNNNRIREDSTILFESKKRKSIYISSKKLLIEVSTYGKEYLVKLYKFSKKGLKLISQKSCLGNKKLKKVIKFLLLALGITLNQFSNIEAKIVDAKAPTYTGESPEKLKDIAKSNGQKVVRQMDRYSDQDPETLSSLYSAGSEPKPPIGLDQIRTLFNLMRLPDNLKGEYKQNVIDGMKESPIFQNSDPQRQEQFLKNIYFLNDNDNFNNNKDK